MKLTITLLNSSLNAMEIPIGVRSRIKLKVFEICAEQTYQLPQCLHFLLIAGFAIKQRGEIEFMVVLGGIRKPPRQCFLGSYLVQSVGQSALF